MSAESKVQPDSHRKGGARPASKKAAARNMDPPPLPLNRRFGGHETTIRLLEPGDCDTLLKFFESHTRETIHLRYGYELSQISEARAAELVGVDQTKDAALGIFEQGQAVPLVAIGRYCLKPRGGSAEIAFVVREDRRHFGMATALLKILLRIAAARGLKNLDAQVLRENQPMLEIFVKMGGTKAGIPGTDSVVVSIDVSRALRRLSK